MIKCSTTPTVEECATRWVLLKDIPDEIMSKYFIFSFVRDPFSRIVSSHHEVGRCAFTELLRGQHAKVDQNSHVISQVACSRVAFRDFAAHSDIAVGRSHASDWRGGWARELRLTCFSSPYLHFFQVHTLTRAVQSGKQIRLDFVGILERISEDWERLKPALDFDAIALPIDKRKHLILPQHAVTSFDEVRHHRSTSNSSIYVPFSTTEKFSNLHVILVCRRFIQDLVCFDLGIPKICIDHPDLVMDFA